MGLIDEAIELEIQAEKTYRSAARATDDPGAGKILTMLADAEAGHAQALRGMHGLGDVRGRGLVDEARAWIHGVVEGGAAAISSDAGLLAVLRRAMVIEATTEAFYREHEATAGEMRERELFSALADSEREHYLLVSSLVEYYNRPNEWIESAEFGLRPEY